MNEYTDVLINARFECINCKGGYVDLWKLVGESFDTGNTISPWDIKEMDIVGNDIVITTSHSKYCLYDKKFDTSLIEDINEVITNGGYSEV